MLQQRRRARASANRLHESEWEGTRRTNSKTGKGSVKSKLCVCNISQNTTKQKSICIRVSLRLRSSLSYRRRRKQSLDNVSTLRGMMFAGGSPICPLA